MKDYTSIFATIRSYIEQDELSLAVSVLSQLTEKLHGSTRNEVSVLQGRLCRLEKELRMATLKYNEISAEKTQIAQATLSLADIICVAITKN